MNQDWEKWGRDISDLVQNAVDSQDFRKLNQSISHAIHDAVSSVQKGMESVGRTVDQTVGQASEEMRRRTAEGTGPQTAYKREPGRVRMQRKELFARKGSVRAGGMAMTICGGIFGGGLGIALFICILVLLLTGAFPVGLRIAIGIMAPFCAASLLMFFKGKSMLAEVKRFRNYIENLRGRTYCNIQELAEATGKSHKFVLKDIRRMIDKGWFLEGHLDRQNTCLIVSHDTYREYEAIQSQREEQQKLEQELKAQQSREPQQGEAGEAAKIVAEGKAYIRRIRECNDAIPGEEISQKISRMEMLVRRIFDRVGQHPETVEEIHRLMVYYLPTTVKLLEAYIELDAQPVDGENIRASKHEIEHTLDTLNTAFEKLLDSLFEHVAWDVSSDISVLQTMLAQEGLTGNDFKREE